MNSENLWQEMERVDEFVIVVDQNVFVTIFGWEIEEKWPLKVLILTPPAKIFNNCPLLGFHWQFFLHTRLWHRERTEKKTASQNKMSIEFYIPQCTGANIRTNKRVTLSLKSERRAFMFSTYQYLQTRQMLFSIGSYICSTHSSGIFNPTV